MDTDEPAGVGINIKITFPDGSDPVYSYMSATRSLDWQLKHLLELNDICELNGWGLHMSRLDLEEN